MVSAHDPLRNWWQQPGAKGDMTREEAYARMADALAQGKEKLAGLHIHFSPIEYTKAGEKRDLEPVIICESAGTQAEDALEFQRMYHQLKRDMQS